MSPILSIDVGETCGVHLTGEIPTTLRMIENPRALKRAMDIVSRAAVAGAIVVIEAWGYASKGKRFNTGWGNGRRAGIWEALCKSAGLEVHYLHPNKWQKPVLYGKGKNPGRDALKALSVRRAEFALKVCPINENAADAYNMGKWVEVELEHGRMPWEGK